MLNQIVIVGRLVREPELIETLLDLYEKKTVLLKAMLNEIKKEKKYESNKFFL